MGLLHFSFFTVVHHIHECLRTRTQEKLKIDGTRRSHTRLLDAAYAAMLNS